MSYRPLSCPLFRHRLVTAALLAGASLALAGCVVSPGRVVVQPPRVGFASEVVVVAPPAPVIETVGVAPYPGYVWVGGYWNWSGGRHVWVPGRWDAPPHPGWRWAPHHWEHVDGGYRLHEGHWERH